MPMNYTNIVDLIGWLGSFMLGICGLPQAIKAWRDGSAKDVSLSFLLLWLGGEFCYVFVTISKFGVVPFLLFNYLLNIVFISIILKFAIRPRE